jgi:hypothetical protein
MKRRSALWVGNTVPMAALDPPFSIHGENRELRRFLHRPAFRAWAARQLGFKPGPAERHSPLPFALPLAALAIHGLIGGSSGTGKTRFLLHLCRWLVALGYSLVLIDPKGETADHLIAQLAADHRDPGSVVVIDPRRMDGVPGGNPFLADLPGDQVAGDLVALVKASASTWGPRLADVLTNACLFVAYHRLSLDELLRLLVVPAYREALLALPPRGPLPLGYEEARRYFQEEFGRWSPSEQIAAIGPVANKLRELLRTPYLRALLCSQTYTLRFDLLWQQPGAIVVRLDRVALGEEGARWLAGLVTHLLFRTALRARGLVPVALVIDELPVVENFVGGAISQIVSLARSQGLTCFVAMQHLSQISDSLRETLLAIAAVQVFFRVGQNDSRLIAHSLAVGTEPRVTRLVASLPPSDRETGEWERTTVVHLVRDPFGKALRLSPAGWDRFRAPTPSGGEPVAALLALARAGGVPRLYVQAPDTGEPVELRAYLAGLRPKDFWFTGPAPLKLVLAFPRPRLTGVERWTETDAGRAWTRCLMDLPVQHAVVRVASQAPEVIKIADVPTPNPDRAQLARFLAESGALNGQSAAQIEAARHGRAASMARLIRGGPALDPEEEEDGSL